MKKKSASQTARKVTKKAVLFTITALAFCASPSSRTAELCICQTTWIGSTGDWFNTSNWSDGQTPDCGGHICPPESGPGQGQINNHGTAQISGQSRTAYACALTLGVNGGSQPDSGGLSVDNGTLSECGELFVGSYGTGKLSITNSGLVSSDVGAQIASFAGSNGSATVDGTNSKWRVLNGGLYVGGTNSSAGGTGLLTVTNGGLVTTADVLHAYKSGTLSGNGTVTTTNGTTIEGTLTPKSGQLTINGNLTFSGAAATMECNVVPASADNVSVSGQTTLTNKISVTLTGTTFTAGTTYILLHTAGALNGTFSIVSIKGGSGDCFTPVVTYDPHNVKLYLEPCD